MLKMSSREKMFLVLFFMTLFVSVSEYVYMNNHSVAVQQIQRTNELLRAGIPIEKIKDSESKQKDGIYSPLVQLWIIGVVLCAGGLWFCMLLLLDERNEVRTSYVTFGSIFLWKILK